MTDNRSRPVLVLGAGAWGSALAVQLSKNNHTVYLWDIDSQLIRTLNLEGSNQRYLPGIQFAANLIPITAFQEHATAIQDIVIATPSHALRSVLEHLKHFDKPSICLACKGFDPETQRLSHDVVTEVLGGVSVAVISGPSFAKEVAQGVPTAITVASQPSETAVHFAKLFHGSNFRTYIHDDVIGVQVGGAVKNSIAIAVGVAGGLGYGANTRAALITRGLSEITRLGVALGARIETFQGLAGAGDLILTCTDPQSRNLRFGQALGQGLSKRQAALKINQTTEGVQAALSAYALSLTHQIEMPITEQVAKLLQGQHTLEQAIQALLSRAPKKEG